MKSRRKLAKANPSIPAGPGKTSNRNRLADIGLVLLGALVGAILTPVAESVFHKLSNWYFEPKLDIRVSMSAYLFGGTVERDTLRDYYILQDVVKGCGVVVFEGKSQDTSLPPWSPSAEITTTVVVENNGRSSLANLKLVLLGDNVGTIQVDTTPNLSIETVQDTSTAALNHPVITIKEISKLSLGIITIKEAHSIPADVNVSVGSVNELTTKLSRYWRRLEVKGAEEARFDGVQMDSVRSVLAIESKSFGQESLHLHSLPLTMQPVPKDMKWFKITPATGGCPHGPGESDNYYWSFTAKSSGIPFSPMLRR